MCGIVGILQKNNYGFFAPQEDSFFQMLYADALRGFDSTGVIAVERDGAFHIAKEAYEATIVIDQIKNEEFFKNRMSSTKPEGKAWIGHNRKSTVGKTTDGNAHPFVINGEFALVHNGTLHNHEKLAKVDVDSQALAIVIHEAMGKEKWQEALETTLGEVYGAYATVWYDQRHNKVFLLRNSQRPLAIIETDTSFVWASEPAMAWWILGRNNVKPDVMKHHSMAEHELFMFDLEKTTMEKVELKPKKATPPAKSSTRTIRSGGGRSPAVGGKTGTQTGGTTHSGVVASTEMSKSQLKHFRRAHVGQLCRFYVDDFVEKNYPHESLERGNAQEVWLMGECDDILLGHSIKALVDIHQLGIHYEEDITERLWIGTVSNVEYDRKTKILSLYVDGSKPMLRSAPKNQPPFPKNPYAQGNLATLKTAVEERVAQMKKQLEETYGDLKEVITKDGKIQLVATEGAMKGQVAYETAIAIH